MTKITSRIADYTANKKAELTAKKKANTDNTAKQKDILKDTPLRTLGYLDDIAAASKPLVEGAKSGLLKSLPSVAYVPAGAYMAANVVDKFRKGDDGTGKEPSIKAGAREAIYQAAANVAAPMAIVTGISKAAKAFPKLLTKLPKGVQEHGKKAFNAVNNNKIGAKFVKLSSFTGKAAVFGASLYALAKLSKPIDNAVDKIMEKTVDPLLNLAEKQIEITKAKAKNKEE